MRNLPAVRKNNKTIHFHYPHNLSNLTHTVRGLGITQKQSHTEQKGKEYKEVENNTHSLTLVWSCILQVTARVHRNHLTYSNTEKSQSWTLKTKSCHVSLLLLSYSVLENGDDRSPCISALTPLLTVALGTHQMPIKWHSLPSFSKTQKENTKRQLAAWDKDWELILELQSQANSVSGRWKLEELEANWNTSPSRLNFNLHSLASSLK